MVIFAPFNNAGIQEGPDVIDINLKATIKVTEKYAFQDAIQRENARASWYNSLYGNINQAFKGLSDYEREVRDRNNVAKMVASGIFPGVNPDNAVYAGYVDKVPKRGANGGKIARKKNKKRGLTI